MVLLLLHVRQHSTVNLPKGIGRYKKFTDKLVNVDKNHTAYDEVLGENQLY